MSCDVAQLARFYITWLYKTLAFCVRRATIALQRHRRLQLTKLQLKENAGS